MELYQCPCCGKYTLELKPTNTFQECNECHWVPIQIRVDSIK